MKRDLKSVKVRPGGNRSGGEVNKSDTSDTDLSKSTTSILKRDEEESKPSVVSRNFIP